MSLETHQNHFAGWEGPSNGDVWGLADQGTVLNGVGELRNNNLYNNWNIKKLIKLHNTVSENVNEESKLLVSENVR